MPQWTPTLISAGVIVIVQLLTAAFVYGMLTERVKNVSVKSEDHQRRLQNIETVLQGTGGHGERLTALEAWRIEHRAQK